MDYEPVQVECYSGYKAEERPVAFVHRDIRREISDIIDRWYEGSRDSSRPEITYFKIKTMDGQVCLLRYVSRFDSWSLRVR